MDAGKLVRITSVQTFCTVRLIDRHNGFFAAIASFIVAIFTFYLWRSTDLLWKAGEQQRESSERIALLQRESAERIGEAQVRAYVNIKTADLAFIASGRILPQVKFVATNSGQSPARNFIWDVTLQYVGGGENKSHIFNENWLNESGIDIPASSDGPLESAIIPYMSVVERIEKVVPGLVSP